MDLEQDVPPTGGGSVDDTSAAASLAIPAEPSMVVMEEDRPADTLPTVVEKLKMEKAELEQTTFIMKANADEIEQKYRTAADQIKVLQGEKDITTTELNERVRLYRSLEASKDELQLKKSEADELCLQLKKDRAEKDLSVRRLTADKQLLAEHNRSLKDQLRDLVGEKQELLVFKHEFEGKRKLTEIELQRAKDEKEMYEGSKKWFMSEIAERDTKIAQLRIEMGAKEIAWQNERLRLCDEKGRADCASQDARSENELHKKQVQELNGRLSTIVDEHEEAIRSLQAEMRGKESVLAIYKENLEKADRAAAEMRELYEKANGLLAEVNEAIMATKAESEENEKIAREVIAAKDKELADLRDELVKANELIQNKHNLNVSDEALEELSPAAAAASRLLRGAGSLTAVYREHAKLYGELLEERERTKMAENSLKEIVDQINERAPQLYQQREELERLTEEREKLESQLKNADKQRVELLEERDWAARELAFTKSELERYQRDSGQLSDQVAHLVFVLEKERGERATTPEAESEDENKLFFSSVRELQRRNIKLEGELASEKKRAHAQAQAAASEEVGTLRKELESMRGEAERMNEMNSRLQTVIKKVEEQREVYRKLVEEGGMSADAATARRHADNAMAQLKEAHARLERVEEWRKEEKEEKERLIRTYEERVDTQLNVLTEVKKTNARLESDLDLQKQTASSTLKELEKVLRESEKWREAELKAKGLCNESDSKLIGTMEKLSDMRAELSKTKVEKRTIEEELKYANGNAQRLQIEMEILRRKEYEEDQVTSALHEVKLRLHRMEEERKTNMDSRLESMEAERDQLKSSHAALDERNQRLEQVHKADLQRLGAEKEDLLSKLEKETAEKASAERVTSELKSKLAATQIHLPAESSSGMNAERLAKECQQLKNDNKFLESQIEDLKKRAETAELNWKKASEECRKMSEMTGTVESNWMEQSTAVSVERERLEGLIQAGEDRAQTAETRVQQLKEMLEKEEKERREVEGNMGERIRQMSEELNMKNGLLDEEEKKVAVLEEKTRGVRQMESSLERRIEELQMELNGVRDDMNRCISEKNTVDEEIEKMKRDAASDEEKYIAERDELNEKKMTLEMQLKTIQSEMDERKIEMEDAQKKRDEQFDHVIKMANELAAREDDMVVDGEKKEEGKNTTEMAALNRYLKEEKQIAVERMMKAEVEMKRIRVQVEEIERERLRLESELKEARIKAHADDMALAEKAQLMEKLKTATLNEQELIQLRHEKERLQRTLQEAQRRRNEHTQEKAQMDIEMKRINETLNSLKSDSDVKTKEVEKMKKESLEKDAVIAKLRSETITAKRTVDNSLKAATSGVELDKLKVENTKLQGELQKTKKDHETEKVEMNAKMTQLRIMAIKYKKEATDLMKAKGVSTGLEEEEVHGEEGKKEEKAMGTSSTDNLYAESGWAASATAVALKRLQEEKEEMGRKVKEAEKEMEAAVGERDEMKSRMTVLTSMQKKMQERLDAYEKKSSGESCIEKTVTVSASEAAGFAPSKSIPSVKYPSPIKSVAATSSPLPVSVPTTTPSAPATTSSALRLSSAPPSQPLFQSTVAWPSQMATTTQAVPNSTTSSISPHGALFGRSIQPTPDVSTSTASERSSDSQQPAISSSEESRKRPATMEEGDGKRMRIEEGETAISSSHGVESVEGMVEEDTRDAGEDEGDDVVEIESDGEEREEEGNEVMIDEDDEDIDENYGEDDVEDVEDESSDDDIQEIVEEERIEDGEVEEEEDDEGDAILDGESDDEVVEMEGEGDSMMAEADQDRGSESDGEGEEEGDATEEKNEEREADAFTQEGKTEEKGDSSLSGQPTQSSEVAESSVKEEGRTARQRSPITWNKEGEECSSSSQSEPRVPVGQRKARNAATVVNSLLRGAAAGLRGTAAGTRGTVRGRGGQMRGRGKRGQ